MSFFRRKKKPESEPKLTREDMEQLVNENIEFADRYAKAGNVSGMEMSMELALKYAQKIGRSFDSQKILEIKLLAYERGEKLMRKKAQELEDAGKLQEAQNAAQLAETYSNEARMIKYTTG